jgi:hypothetical protein
MVCAPPVTTRARRHRIIDFLKPYDEGRTIGL